MLTHEYFAVQEKQNSVLTVCNHRLFKKILRQR